MCRFSTAEVRGNSFRRTVSPESLAEERSRQMISEPPEASRANDTSGRRTRASASAPTRSGRQAIRATHSTCPYEAGVTRPWTRTTPLRTSAW